MKRVKTILAIVLSLMVTMAFGSVTFASTAGTNGSITVKNASLGATYEAYKIFDLTYSGTTSPKNVAYTYTKSGDSDTLFALLNAADSPYTLTQIKGNLYNVEVKKDADGKAKTGADVQAYLKTPAALTAIKANAAKKTPATGVAADGTANAATVVFSSLPEGYYVITSTVSEGTFVTVDSTIPNVTVIDKNQGPTWGNPTGGNDTPDDPDDPNSPPPAAKTNGKSIIENGKAVQANTAKVGDTIDYQIAVDATAFKGEELITYYYIKDTLQSGSFALVGTPTVTVYPWTIVDGARKYDTAETATYTDVKADGETFDLQIPFGLKYGPNAKIVVNYQAKVLSTATIGDDSNTNKANFTFATDPNFDPDAENPPYDPTKPGDPTNPNFPAPPTDTPSFDPDNEVTTYTTTFAAALKKTDADGKVLEGAKFNFLDKDGNGIKLSGSSGVYTYDPNGNADLALEENSDGEIVVKGLEEGTYKFKEIEAPAGYNIKKDPVEVVIGTTKDTTTGKYVYGTDNCSFGGTAATAAEFGGYDAIGGNFVNNPGRELPSTGGLGTTILYILGTILALGAAIVLIARRKIHAE